MFHPASLRTRAVSLLFALVWLAGGPAARGQSSTPRVVPGTQWATQFDGPANHNDRDPVLALDADGAVYVAAETRSLTDNPAFTTPDMDIVTVKYDAAGAQQWAAVFDGEGNFLDYPHDIGVDAAGNVFVTGYSWRGRNEQGGTEYDFVTIKYGPDGARRWVRYYAGPQQRSEADQAFFLDLDAAGSVYVTGMAFYNGWDNRLVGQIVTVKYDADGNELWVRGHRGADSAGSMPQAFDVDGGGNVYVAGQVERYDPVSNTFDSDHVLLKYDAAGNLLYATRHDSPGPNANDDDYVDYLHLDAAGNVYVLGRTTPGYEWPQNDTGRDMVLMKFTPAGSLAWERTWVTPGDDDFKTYEEYGDELVTDAAGNVYLSGHTDDRNLFWAIIAVKFDPAGKLLWHDIYDPGPGDADWPAGIEIAPDGQAVYVGATARNEKDQSHYDFTVIRYAAGGARTVNRYDAYPSAEVLGPIGANRNVMEIDRAGNLYLVGEVQDAGLRPDLLVEKIGNAPLPTPTPIPSPAPPAPALVNHALASRGATATASSTMDAGRAPLGAINGDRKGLHWGSDPATGSGWHDATGGAHPDWLEVSFGGPRTVSEVRLFSVQDHYAAPVEPTEQLTFTKYGVTGFRVEYWNGASWQAVPGAAIANNNHVCVKFTFAPLATAKLRVVVDGALAGYSRVTEFEAWGPAVSTPGPRVNVAAASQGATATASSTLDAGRGPSAVINGDRKGVHWGTNPSTGSGWHDSTRDAYPDWLEITFGGERAVTEVHVFSVQDNYAAPSEPTEAMTFTKYGLQDFDVEYWTGSNWAVVPGGSVTGNNKVWRKLTFPALNTTGIRLSVRKGVGGHSRAVEVEAY